MIAAGARDAYGLPLGGIELGGRRVRVAVASGALAFDGLGWPHERALTHAGLLDPAAFDLIVAKTVTLAGRRGNLDWRAPWRSVRPYRGGAVNAVGLTNAGFDWWVHGALPRALEAGLPIAASLWGTAEEVGEMARRLARVDGAGPLAAVELNASCPNAGHAAEAARAETVVAQARAIADALPDLPLIVKLGAGMPLGAIVDGLFSAAIVPVAFAVNSVPWSVHVASPGAGVARPPDRSPLGALGGGGVSGPPARPVTWAVARALGRLADVPVLWPSVTDTASLTAVAGLGAPAVSLGSVFLRTPWRVAGLVRVATGGLSRPESV